MRPPLNAGENKDGVGMFIGLHVASMRPPLNAGENLARALGIQRR